RRQVRVRDDDDAAAVAAVTAGRATSRHAILASERGDTIAAVAGLDLDDGLVDELHSADIYGIERRRGPISRRAYRMARRVGPRGDRRGVAARGGGVDRRRHRGGDRVRADRDASR